MSASKLFTVWDKATGEVLHRGQCPVGDLPLQNRLYEETRGVVEGWKNPDTQWHDGARWRAKKSMVGVKVSGTVIRGLPSPCRMIIDAEEYIVDDGVAELELTQPGTYRIALSARGYRPHTLEITV